MKKDKRKRLRRHARLSVCEMLERGLDPDVVLKHCPGCQAAGQMDCDIHGDIAAATDGEVSMPPSPQGEMPERDPASMAAPSDPARPQWTCLQGMDGSLVVDSFTGEPRAPRHRLPAWYPQIDRVDWAEYLAWRATLPPGLVIEEWLQDFGVRYVDGSFDPPDLESRERAVDDARAELENAEQED